MEFQNMKRRELQALCKRNNIPANTTNAAMAHSLSLLPTVEGLEEFLRDPTAGDPGSPERSAITSRGVPPRTSTRQKVAKEEPEGSTLAPRTRYGTRRRAVEETGTRKTTTTRTTRRKASDETTVEKGVDKDLQAAFEADMEQSEVSDNSAMLGELKEISEDVSGPSMDSEELSPESQNGSKNDDHEAVDDVEEVSDVDDLKENLENNDAVKEVQEKPSHKVDFHSLNRRDLQSLCKKNKIPANTTNATMADALESIAVVEGLDEVLKECNSQAPHSPTMSETTSSCVRRSLTTRRIIKEPTSSKLITKSCRWSRRKIVEEIDQEKIVVSEIPEAETVVCSSMECAQKTELQTYRRTGSKNTAAKQSEDLEYPGNVKSDEGRLSVDADEIHAVSDALDFVSDTSNDLTQEAAVGNKLDESLEIVATSEKDNEEGNFSIITTENVQQLEHSESMKDDSIIDQSRIECSEVPQQLLSMVNKIGENVRFGRESEDDLEDNEVSSDVEAENKSGESELANFDEAAQEDQMKDDSIIDQSRIECSEVPQQLLSMVNKIGENVRFGRESEDDLEDNEVSSDVEAENKSGESELANFDEAAQEDQMSEKPDSEIPTLAENNFENSGFKDVDQVAEEDQVSEKSDSELPITVEKSYENTELENVDEGPQEDQVSEKFNSELTTLVENRNEKSELEVADEGAQEDQVVEKFNSELTAPVDQPMDLVVVGSDPVQIERNHAEEENSLRKDTASIYQSIEKFDQVLEKFNSELTAPVDQPMDSVVVGSDPVQIERNHAEEENSLRKDTASIYQSIEKFEASSTEFEMTYEVDAESTMHQGGAEGKETPLNNKSLRKLKKMLREKLKATTLLAKKMENLTLKENDDPLASIVEEVVDEEFEDLEGKSDGLASIGAYAAPSSDVVSGEAAKQVLNEDLEDLKGSIVGLHPVTMLSDNLISEDSATGHINVEFVQEIQLNKTPTKMEPQFTTPSKTPISFGRNHISDVNKENIDHSAGRTDSVKASDAKSGKLLSAMSMGKLKKALQQHSVKKRPALLARSENCPVIASP